MSDLTILNKQLEKAKSDGNESLVFEIGAQVGLEIMHFYFVKLNGEYKLAEYYSYSINHPGE